MHFGNKDQFRLSLYMKPKITCMSKWTLYALNHWQSLAPQPYKRQWNKPPLLWGCLMCVLSCNLCYINDLPLWWERCPLYLCPKRRRKLLLPHVEKLAYRAYCPPPTSLLELSLQHQSSCVSPQIRNRPPVADPRCCARWWKETWINIWNNLNKYFFLSKL